MLVFTVLKVFSVLMVVGGLLTLGLAVPALTPTALQVAVAVASIIVVVVGYVFYRKVVELEERVGGSSRRRYRGLLLFLAAIVFLTSLASVVSAQVGYECDMYMCPEYRTRLIIIENFVLFLTLMSMLIAFGPIIFAKTIIGVVFQELQSVAGTAFMALIVLTLFLYPAHVMYVPCGENGAGCYVDTCQLFRAGPPLARFFLSFINPPGYGC